MKSSMLRLSHPLKILDSIIDPVLILVMDDESSGHRVIGIVDVPDVDVSLDIAVTPDRRMQMPLLQWNPDEYATFGIHPGSALPSGVIGALRK
jgi:hypothetical protein